MTNDPGLVFPATPAARQDAAALCHPYADYPAAFLNFTSLQMRSAAFYTGQYELEVVDVSRINSHVIVI